MMAQNLLLEEIVAQVREQFREEVPNGWLLGWDLNRGHAAIREATAPYRASNLTSFDYSFCNWYEVKVRNGYQKWLLTVKISFIVSVFSLYWTRYKSSVEGFVMIADSDERRRLENRVRTAVSGLGYCEIDSAWLNLKVDGVSLELSDPEDVTLGKCLFCDFDG